VGGFGGGLETIAIEFDPRSILAGIQRVNQDLEGLEGKTSGTTAKLQKDWQGVSDLMLRVADKSKNSADSYIRSLERQAAAIGKSGIDKLNSQMEQAIKNYGYSESAINKITAAYERLKKAQEPVENPGERYKALGESIANSIEAPAASAKAAIGGLLEKAGPLGVALAGGATALAAIAAAGYEAAKSLGEYGTRIYDVEVKTGLSAKEVGQFGFAARAVGQDVSVVERTLRGLTAAIEDDSEKGQKARDVLRGFGVDVQGVRDGLVPTKELFSQISEGLNALPNTWARNEAAITVFKKAGIDLIPFLQELNENLETAKGLQFASQADVDRFRGYQKQVAEFSSEWDHLAIKVKEPLAATVLVTLKYLIGDNDPDKNALFEPDKVAKARIAEGIIGQRLSASQTTTHLQMTGQAVSAASAADVSATNAALARWGATKEGLEAALSEAKKNESAALKELEDHNVAGIQHLHEAQVKAAQKQTLLDAIRDADKNKPVVGPTLSTDDLQAMQLAQLGQGLWSSSELSKQHPPESNLSYLRGMVGQYRSQQSNPANNLEDVKDWFEQYKQQQKQQDDAQKATLSFEEQMIKLRNGPDGELAAAKQIYDLRMQTATSVLEQYQAGLDYLKQTAEYQAKADQDHQAELDKQAKQQQEMLEKEHDQVQKTATGLYDTLLTHPTQFGKQLENTLRKQTTNFAAEGLGKMTADALIPGGVKNNDPVKQSTDVNTDATIQNSQAIMAMTAHLAAQLGVSAPSIPGQGGVSAISAPPAPPAHGGASSIITIPVGGGGAVPSLSFGGGLAPGFIGMPNAAFSGPVGAPSGTSSSPYFGEASSTVSLPYFGASAPLFSSSTSDAFSGGGGAFSGTGYQGWEGYMRPGGGGGAGAGTALSLAGTALRTIGTGGGNPAAMIGPGGTSGFTGPVGGGGTTAYGIKALSNLKSFGSNLGPAFGIGQGGMSSDVPFADSDNPLGPQMAPGGSTTFSSVAGSPAVGALMGSGGMMLAENGLLGNNRGTGMGILEGTAGGAMIGFEYGGPIGAAIGATVGFGIGLGEMLAGVESPQNKVIRLVKGMYHINISTKEADQIVSLAKQKYGNDISVAVKSPEVRQMLGIYAAGTGQKNNTISATTPQAGSLVEQGGKLFQQATYQNGQAYTYQSDLPVLGGPVAGNYPNTGGAPSVQNVSISLNGQSAADALEGRVASVVTPSYLANGFSQANQSSDGRTQASADLSQPGLITS
jgi:hypothetical protein